MQLAYSDSFSEGGDWLQDIKKQLKWLEKAAANPYPQPNHEAMHKLGGMLATGGDVGGSVIKRDPQRAKALMRAAIALVAPGSTQWELYNKHFSRFSSEGCFIVNGPEPTGWLKAAFEFSAEFTLLRRCNLCGKVPSAAGGSGQQDADDCCTLKSCSRCRRVEYCSKECQTAAWPEHKKVCVKAPKK